MGKSREVLVLLACRHSEKLCRTRIQLDTCLTKAATHQRGAPGLDVTMGNMLENAGAQNGKRVRSSQVACR